MYQTAESCSMKSFQKELNLTSQKKTLSVQKVPNVMTKHELYYLYMDVIILKVKMKTWVRHISPVGGFGRLGGCL